MKQNRLSLHGVRLVIEEDIVVSNLITKDNYIYEQVSASKALACAGEEMAKNCMEFPEECEEFNKGAVK